jgi:DNA polymerase III delta prime subunit
MKTDYTPTTLDEIVFSNNESRTRLDEILSGRKPFPIAGKNGILIYGLWGTGKTTLARMLPDLLEAAKTGGSSLNVSPTLIRCTRGANGITMINNVCNIAQFCSANDSGLHYFVIDEVDLLTELAQESLKTAMNMPGTVFVMTTNYLDKVDKGIINRSILIEMNAAQPAQWLPFARKVMQSAGVSGITDAQLTAVIATGNGSARNITDALLSVAARVKMAA